MDYRERLRQRADTQKAESASRNPDGKGGGLSFMKLEDGEKRTVRLLAGLSHTPVISAHEVYNDATNQRKLTVCLGQFGLPCAQCDNPEIKLKDYYVLFCFDYDAVGSKLVNAKTKKEFSDNPLKVFQRGPGKGLVNHYTLLDLDEEYNGFNTADCNIKRLGAGLDTQYTFTMARKEAPFKAPDGLTDTQTETLKGILTAVERSDLPYLYGKAMMTFNLPDGVTEWPDPATHTNLVEEE